MEMSRSRVMMEMLTMVKMLAAMMMRILTVII